MKKTILFALLFLFVAVTSAGASSKKGVEPQPEELSSILSLDGKDRKADPVEVQNIRPRSIQEAAYRLGIQSGADWRNKEICKALKARETALNSIFCFRLLLINGKVVPPVIVKTNQGMSVGKKQIIQTGVSYKIVQDAHFVSNPPNWRDYLIETFKVQEVDPILYPRSKEEKDVWEKAVLAGWDIGIKQADRIFKINMRKITRDMRGMILFNLLAGQGFVSLPEIAEERYAVRVGNKTLDLDQTSFSLSKESQFQGENRWKPFRWSR